MHVTPQHWCTKLLTYILFSLNLKILLRLSHNFEVDEHSTLSQPQTVSIASLVSRTFDHDLHEIDTVTELGLGGNRARQQLLDDMLRFDPRDEDPPVAGAQKVLLASINRRYLRRNTYECAANANVHQIRSVFRLWTCKTPSWRTTLNRQHFQCFWCLLFLRDIFGTCNSWCTSFLYSAA